MPIYEYECAACGHCLEALQGVEDPALRKCPECGRSRLQRLLSAPRFRLKGGGWYETDFKKNRQRNIADRPEKADKDAGEKTTDAAEKKTAAKPEKNKATSKPKSSQAPI